LAPPRLLRHDGRAAPLRRHAGRRRQEVGMTRRERALQLAGVAAAVVLAVVVNVLGARHFRRWDWTSAQRFSLSPATTETLAMLDADDRRADVWIVAGHGDPLEGSLRPLVAAYTAASRRL